MTLENTQFYIFTDHANQEETGIPGFGKLHSSFDKGAEAVVGTYHFRTKLSRMLEWHETSPEHNQSANLLFLALIPTHPSLPTGMPELLRSQWDLKIQL